MFLRTYPVLPSKKDLVCASPPPSWWRAEQNNDQPMNDDHTQQPAALLAMSAAASPPRKHRALTHLENFSSVSASGRRWHDWCCWSAAVAAGRRWPTAVILLLQTDCEIVRAPSVIGWRGIYFSNLSRNVSSTPLTRLNNHF